MAALSVLVPTSLGALPTPAGSEVIRAEPKLIDEYMGGYLYEVRGDWDFVLEKDAQAAGLSNELDIATASWAEAETKQLEVPGCFTAQLDGLETFTGAGWYRIRLPLGELPKGMTAWSFYFEGVAHDSKVYVDGVLVEENGFGYLPFAARVSSAGGSRAGKDAIVTVRVSNVIDPDGIPDKEWDGWWNHAGIYRRVFLIGQPAEIGFGPTTIRTHMRDRGVGPRGGWLVLAVPSFFRDPSARAYGIGGYELEGTLTFSGANPDGSDAVFEDTKTLGRSTHGLQFYVPGTVPPWSPGSPNLGELRMTLTDDTRTTTIGRVETVGLREVWVDGPRVILNDKHLRLFGFAYHELYPGRGYAVGVDQIRKDLEGMKALGANFVRSAHYPPHPIVPEICDELGLILWSEIPAWKTSAETLSNIYLLKNELPQQLGRMIGAHGSRPSVCFWSVGNEFDSRDSRVQNYVEKAAEIVRSHDSSRIVTYASDKREKDISLGPVDVISINEYFGWYYGTPDDVGPMLDRMAAQHPWRPIFVSEFGAGAVSGQLSRTPGARRDYSEPTQAAYLRRHIEQIFAPERANYMLGGCVWLWADFADPHRTEKHHPKEWHGVNTKGVVTRDRVPKQSHEMLRELIPTLGITQ